jgi:hypothetical protein
MFVSLVNSGCGRADPPRLYPVVGKVIQNGRPLEFGSISLRLESNSPAAGAGNTPIPTQSAVDAGTVHPTGRIREGGDFEIFTNFCAGAPPGKYRVVVMAVPSRSGGGAHPLNSRSLVDTRYSDPQRSPLVIEVSPTRLTQSYVLELKGEEHATSSTP